ncbi:D-aminopeptidase [Streptomyces sp. V2I9]|nr:D-aminopeptidase [Streptomyces sp. V2I9]
MKILISADMEGATGVTWPADVLPGTPQWERCRSMFTSDVNAAALGFYDGGADEVLVNEAHWSMRNLLLEHMDERVEMLTGKHKSLSMVEGIQHGDVDAVAFVGYHTGAGTEGVLAHTYLANSITGVWLNGTRASEGLLNAHVAAEYGVPVVLVTGDDLTCVDADGYAPDARKVAVKDYVSRYAAVCRTPRPYRRRHPGGGPERHRARGPAGPCHRRDVHRGAGVRRRTPGGGGHRRSRSRGERREARRVHQRDDVRRNSHVQGGDDDRVGRRGGTVWLRPPTRSDPWTSRRSTKWWRSPPS